MSEMFTEETLLRFIQDELRLLNQNAFDDWIDLFTDDGLYCMPLDESQADVSTYDMIMYDNKALMNIRKENFNHPASPSMKYPMRSMRMVSGCRVIEVDAVSCKTETPFMASIFYQEMHWYAGNYYHEFTLIDGVLKIKRKQVNLLNMGAPLSAIMTYL